MLWRRRKIEDMSISEIRATGYSSMNVRDKQKVKIMMILRRMKTRRKRRKEKKNNS